MHAHDWGWACAQTGPNKLSNGDKNFGAPDECQLNHKMQKLIPLGINELVVKMDHGDNAVFYCRLPRLIIYKRVWICV